MHVKSSFGDFSDLCIATSGLLTEEDIHEDIVQGH